MFDLCEFYLSKVIPAMFNTSAVYFAFAAVSVFGVWSLVVNLMRGKGMTLRKFADLGVIDTSDSLILIDEITMDADNRQFKSFPVTARDAFILHRKYGCDIIYFTQNWNAVDKKIRDLTAELYYLKRLPFLTVGTRIFRRMDINDYSSEIVYGYRFPNLWERIKSWIVPGFTIYCSCFRPRWYKYFDTFEAPVLPVVDIPMWNT